MGLIGDIWDGVCEAASSVGEACRSVVDSIGNVVEKVKPFICEIPKLPVGVFELVAEIVVTVGKILDLFKTEDPEELGDKVLQGEDAGISLESCGNDFQEYKKRIDAFEPDPEKTAQTSKYDKLLAAGTFCEASLQEEYGFGLGTLVPFIAKNPQFCSPNRVAAWIKACNDIGASTDQIANYFRGEVHGKEASNVENNIFVATEARTGSDADPAQIKYEYRDKIEA